MATAKKHISNLSEMKDVGILLPTNAFHDIRVLGAQRIARQRELPPSKEELAAAIKDSNLSAYQQGSVQGTQEDPQANEFHPQVPSYDLTTDGELVFLERELE